ncbi:hypothetical protein AB0H12_25770 [Actinosynnema sp. NPDC023794]
MTSAREPDDLVGRSYSDGVVALRGAFTPGWADRSREDVGIHPERLPEEVRAHLAGRVVDRLEPLVQKHADEGLVMGAAE